MPKDQDSIYRRFKVKTNEPALLKKAEQIIHESGLTRDELITVLKVFELNESCF